MKQFLPTFLLVTLVTITIEILNRIGTWDAQLIPPASLIAETIMENKDSFFSAFWDTLKLSAESLLLSFVSFSLNLVSIDISAMTWPSFFILFDLKMI